MVEGLDGFTPLSGSDGKERRYEDDGPMSKVAFEMYVKKYLNEKKWMGGSLHFYPVEGEFAETLNTVDKQSCIDHYVARPDGLVFAIASRVHFWKDRPTYPEKSILTRIHRGRKWPDYDDVQTEYQKMKAIRESGAMHPNFIVESYLGRAMEVLYVAIVRWDTYASFLLSHTLERGSKVRLTKWDHEIPVIKNSQDGTWFSSQPVAHLKEKFPTDVEIFEGE